MKFIEELWNGIVSTSVWEWAAVVASIVYVILAVRKSIYCWLFAIIASCLYIYLCYVSQLYLETVLQFFYLLTAITGWVFWHSKKHERKDIHKWSPSFHVFNIIGSTGFALTLGFIFDNYTDQANPYIDAFTTCFSLVATFMVVRKILENWLYWIVIDAVSIYLYTSRGLQLTAVLFFVFTVLAIAGYLSWRKQYKVQEK